MKNIDDERITTEIRGGVIEFVENLTNGEPFPILDEKLARRELWGSIAEAFNLPPDHEEVKTIFNQLTDIAACDLDEEAREKYERIKSFNPDVEIQAMY